ncbi:PAS domain S-box protein [Hydrogenophaga sp. 5NK40-0174]|uniref:PAS domain S-box protein n=1 Tax=Hydrogenophaga sp. 5NK40-0174 TaxID=3127649 RepID=UPI00310BF889
MADREPQSSFYSESELFSSTFEDAPVERKRPWYKSLRTRLTLLSLAPILVVLPLVLIVLHHVAEARIDDMRESSLRSDLASAHTFVARMKWEATSELSQAANNEELTALIDSGATKGRLHPLLRRLANERNLDALLVIDDDGHIMASDSLLASDALAPRVLFTHKDPSQISEAGLARLDESTLLTLGNRTAARWQAALNTGPRTRYHPPALVLHTSVQLPTEKDGRKLSLVGVTFINGHSPMLQRLRRALYADTSDTQASGGIAVVLVEDKVIASSRPRGEDIERIGSDITGAEAASHQDGQWHEPIMHGGQEYAIGFEPLITSDGQNVGTLGLGFPIEPYTQTKAMLMASVGTAMAVGMVLLSVLFGLMGRDLSKRLQDIGNTMVAVRQGRRNKRVKATNRVDELGTVARGFNRMLDTIEEQYLTQQAAQEAAAAEVSRRRALFEAERDGVVIVNPDGTVFEANPAIAKLLGYTYEEMQCLHVTDWESAKDPEQVKEIISSLTGEGHVFETELKRKDGWRFPAEVSLSKAAWGNSTFVFALIRDISARKAVEEELDRYQQTLEELVEHRTRELNDRNEELDTVFAISPDGLVSFDRNGKVISVNQAFLRMTDLNRAQVEGLREDTFDALIRARCESPQTYPGIRVMREQLEARKLGDAKPGAVGRTRLSLNGPPPRVLDIAIQLSEGGEVAQVLYVRDVTRETEIDRMKSEFLSTAAHELRTPMASIFGFSELLLMRKFGEDKRRDLLETISRQASRMSTIIDELLDLARIEARQGKDFVLESIELKELISQVAGDYSPPPGRNSPRLSLPESPLPIRVDKGKLQQALLNIISNAYKYSPDGGDVDIACMLGDEETRVGIQIRDHGMGMTPEQLARVFERFFRADDSGHIPGTGLGMSIVKEIIEIHGGEVLVDSDFGKGTTVTFWLPAHQDAEAEAALPEASQ